MTAIAETNSTEHSEHSEDSPQKTGQIVREREVGFEHSHDLAQVLERLNASLLISTYQAGKVAVLGSQRRKLSVALHNFDRPMGIAIHPSGDTMAVAAKNKVWMLRNDRHVAANLDRPGDHGACFLSQSAQVTGEIQAHEMAWVGSELWIVNTLFSCLCTLDSRHSFIPRWKPPFISNLAPEDRCHLNGLALLAGRPKYVTAMAQADTAGGWRPNKVETGLLMDIETNEVVADGFAMPHSPCVHMGQIWLLDSGRGALVRVNPKTGQVATTARFPGYTRGLAMIDRFAFVGLSKIRETSTFGGVPIAENRARLKCGVGVVNIQTGELVGQFEFTSGVEEIFDVDLVLDSKLTEMRGPYSSEDGYKPIWTVPPVENLR